MIAQIKQSKLIGNIAKNPFAAPLVVFIIGVVFFPLFGVDLWLSDSSRYLTKAMNIYNNFDFNNIVIARPIFPFIITSFFHLFGFSVKSAFLVVRVFFLLNLILCYFLGKNFFNKTTGIVFSLLVLTSFTINEWSSYLLLDAIVPFFILLYILFLYIALEDSSYKFFIFSGITFAIAFLLKEVSAFVFIFLPFILLIFKKYRNIKNIRGVALMCIIFILLLSPWIYRIIFLNSGSDLIFGQMINFDKIRGYGLTVSSSEFESEGSIFKIFLDRLVYFGDFLSKYIVDKFIISALFLFGIIYSFYRAVFRKSRSSATLLISVILFLPIIYVTSKMNFRTGQMMFLYFVLYLMAANLLVNFLREVKIFNFKNKKIIIRNLTIFIILSSLFVQIFTTKEGDHKNFYGLIKNKKIDKVYGFSFFREGFELDGWASQDVINTSEWIKNNIPGGSYVLCQWHYRQAINFFTKSEYKLMAMGRVHATQKTIKKLSIKGKEKAVFVWPTYDGFFVLLEYNDFLKRINNNRIDYVIITPRRNFFSLYLEDNPKFSLVKEFSDGEIKIYKVKKFPVGNHNFPLHFGMNTYSRLNRLYKEDSYKYEEEKKVLGIILKYANWQKRKISKFFSFIEKDDKNGFRDSYKTFNEWKTY